MASPDGSSNMEQSLVKLVRGWACLFLTSSPLLTPSAARRPLAALPLRLPNHSRTSYAAPARIPGAGLGQCASGSQRQHLRQLSVSARQANFRHAQDPPLRAPHLSVPPVPRQPNRLIQATTIGRGHGNTFLCRATRRWQEICA